MTTEQLEKGKELESKIDTLKKSLFMSNRECIPISMIFKFSNCPYDPYDRNESRDSASNDIVAAEISEWFTDEMNDIIDRIRTKFAKKIKQLETELAKL